MTSWTPTARQELENHLAGLRRSLDGSGADPDEVLEDVRRHVVEEAAAARLPVVTEADVRRFLERVAPLGDRWSDSAPIRPGRGGRRPGRGSEPAPVGEPVREASFGAWLRGLVLWRFSGCCCPR
jgi:hypothetical protein